MPENIITFPNKNLPDDNLLSSDIEGNKLNLYSIDFKHRGRRFSLEVWAGDRKELKAIVKSLKSTGKAGDQIISKVPVDLKQVEHLL